MSTTLRRSLAPMIIAGLAVTGALALPLSAAATGGTVFVDLAWAGTAAGADPDGAGPATSFGTDSFATITDALAVAPAIIQIGAGTYVEQVVITSSTELIGQGQGVTVIQDSATHALFNGLHPIVVATNAATATLSNLTITGPNTDASGPRFVGFYAIDGAQANLTDVTLTTVRNNPLSGVQSGAGIILGNSTAASAATATLTNVLVTDYQKVGIVIRAQSSAVITNSTVQGRGTTCINAQNGIQIEGGATITGTAVVDNRYDDTLGVAGCGAAGTTLDDNIMSYGIRANNATGPVSITNNTIARNENNVTINSTSAAGTPLTISDNTITGLNAVATGRLLNDTSIGIYTEWARPGAVISRNTITATTWGVYVDAGAGGEQIVTNTITLNTAGLAMYGQPLMLAANRIVGNVDGAIGESGTAGPNWWGCNEGPGAAGCDTNAGGYSEPEWLVLSIALASCQVTVGSGIPVSLLLSTTSSGAGFTDAYVPPTAVSLTGDSQLAAAPSSGTTSDGRFDTQLTGTAAGNAVVTAAADNARVTVPSESGCTTLTVLPGPVVPVVPAVVATLAPTGTPLPANPAGLALVLAAAGLMLLRLRRRNRLS